VGWPAATERAGPLCAKCRQTLLYTRGRFRIPQLLRDLQGSAPELLCTLGCVERSCPLARAIEVVESLDRIVAARKMVRDDFQAVVERSGELPFESGGDHAVEG